MFNIAQTLSQVAQETGDKIGLIEAKTGFSMTFSQLENTACKYSYYLHKEGLRAGDRVILMVKPSADFICLTFALFKLGAPVILIDPGMGYKNLLSCIGKVKPDYLIGIPQAILLSKVYKKPFRTIKKRFCCGSLLGLTGKDLRKEVFPAPPELPVFHPNNDSLAAIIFTTGSTGPPKGVRFEHSIFSAQLDYIRTYYLINSSDTDQPGFPLFGLFSIALGACAVIPDMNPSRPAQVNPKNFMESIEKYGVTYSFGSPAIWNVVSTYCINNDIKSTSLKKILMAGAPVPGDLIKRVYRIMEGDGEIYTPYGATESLPIVSLEGREILEETWDKTRNGKGTCVGRALPGIDIKIIKDSDYLFKSIADCQILPAHHIGEIIVKGPVVTRSYENNEDETLLSKIPDKKSFWHRMGDMGYLDENDRLWFCGRKAHRVHGSDGYMYTIQCEAIINEHPDVYRSALVGLKGEGEIETPVMIVEMSKGAQRKEQELLQEVKEIASHHPLTCNITHFLIHKSFPVDIRHNAKIFREKLQVWAQTVLVK